MLNVRLPDYGVNSILNFKSLHSIWCSFDLWLRPHRHVSVLKVLVVAAVTPAVHVTGVWTCVDVVDRKSAGTGSFVCVCVCVCVCVYVCVCVCVFSVTHHSLFSPWCHPPPPPPPLLLNGSILIKLLRDVAAL